MKMKALSAVVALAGLAGAANAQLPIVSNIPGTFIDIATGAALVTGDDSSAPFALNLAPANSVFPNGTLNVCTNGHAGYVQAFTGFGNFAIPSASFYGGNMGLAPFFDDLITNVTGSGVYAATVGGVAVIQWNARDTYSSSPSQGTFEIQIFPDSSGPGGAVAQFLYRDVDFGNANNNGASATIGYQTNGTSGTQWSLNTASIQSGTVLSIVPAPGSIGLLALGGMLAARRRRA